MAKGSKRKQTSIKQRRKVVREYKASGMSIRGFALKKPMSRSTLQDWIREDDAPCVPQNRFRRKGAGRKPSTLAVEANIVMYAKDMHRIGEPVSRTGIIAYCAWRFRSFRSKSYWARRQWAHRFVRRHNLSDRVVQHTGTQTLAELESVRVAFAANVNRLLEEKGFLADDIWNIDETGVVYDMKPTRVVVPRGTKKVAARNLETTQKSFRVSAICGISAAGKKAPPYIIMPAKRGGPIERVELPTLPPGAVYGVQDNGWTDEIGLLEFIELVMRPIAKQRQNPQLLILDALSTHMTPAVRTKLEECNFSWVYVPPGSTSVCQPLDVGVFGTFKHALRVRTETLVHERRWAQRISHFHDHAAATVAAEGNNGGGEQESGSESDSSTIMFSDASDASSSDDFSSDESWLEDGFDKDDADVVSLSELVDTKWLDDMMGEDEDARFRRRALSQRVIECWETDVRPETAIKSFHSVGIFARRDVPTKSTMPTKPTMPTNCDKPVLSGSPTHSATASSSDARSDWRDKLLLKPPSRPNAPVIAIESISVPSVELFKATDFTRTTSDFHTAWTKTDIKPEVQTQEYEGWKDAMYHADDKVTRIQRTPKKSRKETQSRCSFDPNPPTLPTRAAAETKAHPSTHSNDKKEHAAKTAPKKLKRAENDVVCSTDQVCFQQDRPTMKLSVSVGDMKCLAPKAWLNDVVITYYMQRYCKPPPSCVTFDCQLYPQLSIYHRAVGFSKTAYEKYCGIAATLDWGYSFCCRPRERHNALESGSH